MPNRVEYMRLKELSTTPGTAGDLRLKYFAANSGLAYGTAADHALAFYKSRSGLPAGTLADHQEAFYRNGGVIGGGAPAYTGPNVVSNLIPYPSAKGGSGAQAGTTIALDTTLRGGGLNAFKLTPTGSSNDSRMSMNGDTGAMRLGMEAGKTYTVAATARLVTAQASGTLNARARRIVVFHRIGAAGYTEVLSDALPNVSGATQRLVGTFTLPAGTTEAFIRFYNGSISAADIVYWYDLSLVEGAVDYGYFDGSTTDTTDFDYLWVGTGAADVNPSIRFYKKAPTQPTAFLWDDFNTNTPSITLAGQIAPLGGTWTRLGSSSGALSVDGDRVRTSATGTGYYGAGTPASADYTVEADFVCLSHLTAATAGIVVRGQAGAQLNYYAFRYNQSTSAWDIVKQVASTGSAIAAASGAPTILAGQTYRIKLKVQGTTLTAWIDGVQVAQATDASLAAAGQPGLVTGGTGGGSATTGYHLDNVVAY